MLKRKGQTEYEPSGYINIPLWMEGYERRVAVGDDQIHVRVVERMDGQRVIYTVEIELAERRRADWRNVPEPCRGDTCAGRIDVTLVDVATKELEARRESLERQLVAVVSGTLLLAPEEIAAIRVHIVEIRTVLPRR